MVRATLVLLFVGEFGVLSASAAEPKPQEKVWRNPKDDMEFVWIPAGSFTAEVLDKDKKPCVCE